MHSRSDRRVTQNRHRLVALSILTIATAMVAAQIRSTVAESASSLKVTNLIGSAGSGGKRKDPRMVNAWGLAFIRGEAFWVNDESRGVSELIDGNGTIFRSLPFVTVPGATGGPGKPTGIVANLTGEFPLPSAPTSTFIFDTEDGTIAGWYSGATAATIVNNSGEAAYTGLALAAPEPAG